jgi:hypothetical protein
MGILLQHIDLLIWRDRALLTGVHKPASWEISGLKNVRPGRSHVAHFFLALCPSGGDCRMHHRWRKANSLLSPVLKLYGELTFEIAGAGGFSRQFPVISLLFPCYSLLFPCCSCA